MTSPNERPDAPPLPPSPIEPGAPAETPAAVPPPAMPAATAGDQLKSSLESGARAFDERAQALGKEAEAAVNRWGQNPAVRETADMAGRIWGLVLLAFGLWFLADVTLKMDLPRIAWGDLWPIVLIVLGGLVVVRGMARRR
jgi:hypothetical protein